MSVQHVYDLRLACGCRLPDFKQFASIAPQPGDPLWCPWHTKYTRVTESQDLGGEDLVASQGAQTKRDRDPHPPGAGASPRD